MGNEYEEQRWSRRHATLHRVQLSELYHRRRERWFEGLDRAAKAVALIGGSAALASVADAGILRALALLITVASAASLVIGFSERARRHAELASRFKLLERDIIAAGVFAYTDEQLAQWDARRAEIESAEPAALAVVVAQCERDLNVASGFPDRGPHLTLWQRMHAHLW